MPDLFPKKIYGDATDYFNLSSFQPVLIFSFFFRKIIASKPRLKSLQLQEQVFFNKENFLRRCCVSPIMLRTTWLIILLLIRKEAASNINVSQLFCSVYRWQKGRSRSTLCIDVCYSKNRNNNVALSFWLTLDHTSGRGFSTKFDMERLPLRSNPLTLLRTISW